MKQAESREMQPWCQRDNWRGKPGEVPVSYSKLRDGEHVIHHLHPAEHPKGLLRYLAELVTKSGPLKEELTFSKIQQC